MTINTNLYCLVDISRPDPIPVLEGPKRLPQNWRDPEGFWHFNINNSILYPDAQLIVLGWYPYVEIDAGVPVPYSQYYDRTLGDFVVVRDVNASRDAIYVQWDIERVRGVKVASLDGTIPLYDGSEMISNPDRQFEVEDVTAWVADSVVDLEDLDVWEDVAAFDILLPDPVPIGNTYLGERQAKQGTDLLSEDYARSQAEGQTRSSSPTVSAWLKTCFDAADDVTGSTSVDDPPAEIRQTINNPNEFHATGQIVRKQWEAPDPAPGYGVRIKIRPREGEWRTIIARLYDELGSFVYELSFVEAKPGLWAAETPGAYRTSVPETIMVELGYGSASPFTKKYAIPAAKQRLTKKIRYNR